MVILRYFILGYIINFSLFCFSTVYLIYFSDEYSIDKYKLTSTDKTTGSVSAEYPIDKYKLTSIDKTTGSVSAEYPIDKYKLTSID